MKTYKSLNEVKRDYEDKQKEKPEITPPEHSQRYEEKLKKYKRPALEGKPKY